MPAPWRLRSADPRRVRTLAETHALPAVLATVLCHRGLDESALGPHLSRSAALLHDPGALPGMAAATERLVRAIRRGETILVHGDYDVDGVTGTVLLMRALELVGAKAVWHIPNRLEDGYSFGPHSLERARAVGATLVVSVDNGTSAFETIAELAAAGIDTLVTDHHEPPAPHPVYGALPQAAAIVNPKLPGSTYPWRELCGGAVAFKLVWGLLRALGGESRVGPKEKVFLEEALAYVAIATVCDVVPLLDENRVMAHLGLKALALAKHPGLVALVESCGLGGRIPSAEDVAFQVGPRINASGRLGSAAQAVALLLAREPGEARRLAGELDRLNQERKRIEKEVLAAARSAARPFSDRERHPVLVLAGQGWHQGVVGIVAARLVEEFERPAIVIGLDGAEGRGSARSVPGFHVLEALSAAAPHLERFGGHAQAAGLEVRADAIEAVRAAVEARAFELLRAAPPEPASLAIDAELPLSELTPALMQQLSRLEPFGAACEKPVFLSSDLRLAAPPRVLGQDGRHLALEVRRGAALHRALAFGQAARLSELRLGEPLHLVHTPRYSTFRGETRLELLAHDFACGPLPPCS